MSSTAVNRDRTERVEVRERTAVVEETKAAFKTTEFAAAWQRSLPVRGRRPPHRVRCPCSVVDGTETRAHRHRSRLMAGGCPARQPATSSTLPTDSGQSPEPENLPVPGSACDTQQEEVRRGDRPTRAASSQHRYTSGRHDLAGARLRRNLQGGGRAWKQYASLRGREDTEGQARPAASWTSP